MAWDRKVFRSSQDAVGAPGDPAAINPTDDNTMVALLKGLFALLSDTIEVSAPVGGSTEAKQDTAITALGTLATQTTAAAILAKLSADPATQATLAAVLAKLNAGVGVTGTFWQATQPVSLATAPALVAGSALIGRAVADASAAAGGIASTARLASSAASTNAANVKTSAGRVYAVQGINKAAYDVFLVLYDAATSPPVPGTTTIRKKIAIPAGNAFALDWPLGLSFANGIGYAFTKLAADSDTTALASGDVQQLNLDYV